MFEYIRVVYHGSLEELNALASAGWRLVSTCQISGMVHFILEREIPVPDHERVREHYIKAAKD